MEPGLPIPVVITAYADKSFTFIMKTPPATVLIKKAAEDRQGQRQAAHRQGGQDHARPGRRNRQDQDARPDRRRSGCRRAHHRRQRPQHGHQRGGVCDMAQSFPSASRRCAPRSTATSLSGRRGAEAGQGNRHRQVRRVGRRRRQSRRRRQEVGPDGARLGRAARGYRQDGARRGVRAGRQGRGGQGRRRRHRRLRRPGREDQGRQHGFRRRHRLARMRCASSASSARSSVRAA